MGVFIGLCISTPMKLTPSLFFVDSWPFLAKSWPFSSLARSASIDR